MEKGTHRLRDIILGLMGSVFLWAGGIALQFGFEIGWAMMIYGAIMLLNYTTITTISRKEYEEQGYEILGVQGLIGLFSKKEAEKPASEPDSGQKNASLKGRQRVKAA
jgi:hypothetical protein